MNQPENTTQYLAPWLCKFYKPSASSEVPDQDAATQFQAPKSTPNQAGGKGLLVSIPAGPGAAAAGPKVRLDERKRDS